MRIYTLQSISSISLWLWFQTSSINELLCPPPPEKNKNMLVQCQTDICFILSIFSFISWNNSRWHTLIGQSDSVLFQWYWPRHRQLLSSDAQTLLNPSQRRLQPQRRCCSANFPAVLCTIYSAVGELHEIV